MSDWNTVNVSNGAGEKERVEYEIEGEDSSTTAAATADADATGEASRESKSRDKVGTPTATTASSAVEGDKDTEDNPLEGVETKGAQKRIRQLIQQRKERDDLIASLEKEKEELRKKATIQERDLALSLKNNIDSSEQQLLNRIDYAKRTYQQAVEAGDSNEMLQAQEQISQSHAELVGLRGNKEAWKRYNQEVETRVQEQQQSPRTTAAQQPQPVNKPEYDPKAVVWAADNEWFGSNNVMTAAALAIDYELKNEGYDPSDDDFYQEIDRRMHEQFPHKFQGSAEGKSSARQTRSSNSSQVVAGASRSSASPSSKKIRLTQEDVRLANKWGIPLEKYAEEKLKAERSVGEYTTIG